MEQSRKAPLNAEDYTEPRCPLDIKNKGKERPVYRIPLGRVIKKLDEYLDRNDYESAVKTLHYWEEEAKTGNDDTGLLQIYNELMGVYRKTGNEEKACSYASLALDLSEELSYSDTISGGTTYINAATVYKNFGMTDKALPLYEKALFIYERDLKEKDPRLAGLYNNYGISLTAAGDYNRASSYFEKALKINEMQDEIMPENAVTYLNMADLVYARDGAEGGYDEINALLEKAEKVLDDGKMKRDGNYAFVCEKCAPVFSFYGWFMTEIELNKRAKDIYERN